MAKPGLHVPPHSIEIERAVLGAMLANPDCIPLGLHRLHAEDFFTDNHRDLFTAISALHAGGAAADLLTVSAHLGLSGPDTMAWLIALTDEAFTATPYNFESHAAALLDYAAKRELLALGIDLQHQASNGATPKTLFAMATERLERAQRAGRARPEGAQIVNDGDRLTFTWPGSPVRVDVSGLRDGSEGASAEVAVHYHERRLHWARLNLASTTTREAFVKRLLVPDQDWRGLLEEVSYQTVGHLRQGEPAVQLVAAPFTGSRFLVDPFLWHSDVSFLFADGGSGKGFIALVTCIAAAAGRTIAVIHPRADHGLRMVYCDWESSAEDLADRLHRLGQGLGVGTNDLPIYRLGMDRPLAQDLPRVRAECTRARADFLVVDSWMPACGISRDGAGADTAVAAFQALRSLSRPALAIAHVSKVMADQKSQSRIYGSVFNSNLSRNVWEVKRSEDSDADTMMLGLFHTKVNEIARRKAFGLRFGFNGDAGPVTVSTNSLTGSSSSDLTNKIPASQRILAMLATGALTTEEIIEATGLAGNAVRARLGELALRGKVLKLGGGTGHASATWGLRARKDDSP